MPKSETTEPAGPERRKRRIRGVVLGLVCLLALVMLSVPVLDSVGHRWVQCEVTEASGQQGDQNAVSAWVVVIDTHECGRLVYSADVNQGNVEERAAEFSTGSYEFKMGLTSQLAAQGLVPGMNPSFDEYRPVQ